MRMIVHDLEQSVWEKIGVTINEGDEVISDNGTIENCMECDRCWTDSQGICIKQDGYRCVGPFFSECSQLVLISRCVYGGFSPFIQNVIERCRTQLIPKLQMRHSQTHYALRSSNRNKYGLICCFYGDNITLKEEETARMLSIADGISLQAAGVKIMFFEGLEKLRGVKEVLG